MPYKLDKNSPYAEKVANLVPSEFIMVYLSIDVLVEKKQDVTFIVTLAAMLILLVLLPFYLWRVCKLRNRLQIALMMISFVVWVYALGGPFPTLRIWWPQSGAAILALWSLVPPIFGLEKQPVRVEEPQEAHEVQNAHP